MAGLVMWASLFATPVLSAAQEAPSRGASGATQDSLTRARGLYESADYEQALQLLDVLKGQNASTEVAAYQMFCLVALGRKDEARVAIEAIVRVDPLFRPSESQVSPRIRSFFDDVRRPLLPEIVKSSYGKAKAAFDHQEWAAAQTEFDRVIALIDETAGSDPSAADLRTLAAGFRDLAKSASKPAPKPTPAPSPSPTATPTPPPAPARAIYGDEDAGLIRPVPISKRLPEWRPNVVEAKMTFSGQVDVVVGTDGKVQSVSLVQFINPRYDSLLVEDGVPVKYRYSVAVKLAPSK
jgi:tetratricopeptide (TPR) repeat protein